MRTFKKAKTYSGQKIKGIVRVEYKIDGVRLLYDEETDTIHTRNGKVPPGLEFCLTESAIAKIKRHKDCEVQCEDFLTTASALNSKKDAGIRINGGWVYPLEDEEACYSELGMTIIRDPEKDEIERLMKIALMEGYEGLVLKDERGGWFRVKPTKSADVRVTGWFEQKDKHGNPKGCLGGFTTKYGKVTAFTDEMRRELWDNPDQYLWRMMEVQYKELYHTGKFRYAVKFLNWRDDKDEESFDEKIWLE